VTPYNAVSGHCQSGSPRPNGSTADPAISSLSHEHNEVITDPLGNAYIDGSFQENGDLCVDMTKNPPPVLGGSGSSGYDQVIGGGHYWLQMEWSNDDGGCAARDEVDSLSSAGPPSARVGARVVFQARGVDPDGRISASAWSFGDGSRGQGSRPRHAYRHAGRYTVSVRSTDSDGLWAFASRTIRITPSRRAHH
jgi:hypothetical protein